MQKIKEKFFRLLSIPDAERLQDSRELRRRFCYLLFFPAYLLCFFMLERADLGEYYQVSSRFDDYIPFCAHFIYFYIAWFFFCAWGIATFLFRKERTDYDRICLNLFLGMILFLVFSYVFPNELAIRHVISRPSNLSEWLVYVIQKSDTPKNVLPSIHVFNSFAIMDAVTHSVCFEKKPLHRWGVRLLTVGITLSTVFLKQHSVIDLSLGILIQLCMYPFFYGRASRIREHLSDRVFR